MAVMTGHHITKSTQSNILWTWILCLLFILYLFRFCSVWGRMLTSYCVSVVKGSKGIFFCR